MDSLRLVHSHLILSTSLDQATFPENAGPEIELAKIILNGEYHYLLQHDSILPIIQSHKNLLANEDINTGLSAFSKQVITQDEQAALFLAIASLYLFIQNNFTGPQSPLNSVEFLYPTDTNPEELQSRAINALSAYGQIAYHGSEDPVFLLLSLHILEQLSKVSKSLLLNHFDSTQEFVEDQVVSQDDVFVAVVNWWRSRAIMIQLSLFPEFSGPHVAVAASILNDSVVKAVGFNLDEELQKKLSIVYYLEKAKNALDSNMEHLALPNLINVRNSTNFEFVLTGAKAKRTKFQQVAHSGLIILAKSNYFTNTRTDNGQTPENFDLNSDLLLEKPHFEDIGSENLDEQIYKKQKTDLQDVDYSQLLPVSLRSEYIPESLKTLDPNNQPTLSDYDNIQLLLRLYTLRQTSPSNDLLVSSQLMSLVSRVLYQSQTTSINYTVFSRALWERSILETTKARTIERGILQMQSLVEEIGLKIQTRYIPSTTKVSTVATRSKYLFQLPLIPRWDLDTKLAEKFMSLGLVKSAIEIYERLGLDVDVALCHASIGEESKALEIIKTRIQTHPNDARAVSIMGDLTGEPEYWLKAWEMAKYVKAKVSLCKYYYYPPQGVTKNIEESVKHMHDALSINPLNFANWYFYGCLGLESSQFELAAEAFTRCVALDDSNSLAWSNLASAHLSLDRTKEAFAALKKAVATDDNKKSWRIWDNYLIVAAKLHDWDEVLLACKRLVENRKDKSGEGSIDIPVVEKLVEILVSNPYPEDASELNFFQRNCIEFTTVTLPEVVTSSARLWRIIARVELWRQKPWASLDCHEKAYRAISHNPDLDVDEKIWNETVEACADLVAAYESLGELPGKHGAGDLVCKDWKYKAKSTVKSLMSKGKQSWEYSEGWEQLTDLRNSL